MPPIVNGRRAPERLVSVPMDTAIPEEYKDVEVSSLGIGPRVRIEEDLPLPLEVVAVYGEMTTGAT